MGVFGRVSPQLCSSSQICINKYKLIKRKFRQDTSERTASSLAAAMFRIRWAVSGSKFMSKLRSFSSFRLPRPAPVLPPCPGAYAALPRGPAPASNAPGAKAPSLSPRRFTATTPTWTTWSILEYVERGLHTLRDTAVLHNDIIVTAVQNVVVLERAKYRFGLLACLVLFSIYSRERGKQVDSTCNNHEPITSECK